MAHPKRRKSKSKSRKHRTHYKAEKPGLSYDAGEDQFHLPHRISPSGTYKGVKYIDREE